MAALENEVRNLREDMSFLRDDFRSVKLALWGLAATLIGTAIGFAFAVVAGAFG